MAASSSSHAPVLRLSSWVREALVESVTCTAPSVSFQISQVSMVPAASSPASARARAPSTWSSSHAILLAEKYGSIPSPVRSRTKSSCPAAMSMSHASEVRRSCHTMALWIGTPVARSQMTTVSRWLVTPTAASSSAEMPASAMALSATSYCWLQSTSGSCSTQPACGKICGSAICACESLAPVSSNTIARELVVP